MLNTSVNIASSEQLYVSTEAKFYNYHTNIQKVPVTFAPTYSVFNQMNILNLLKGMLRTFVNEQGL